MNDRDLSRQGDLAKADRTLERVLAHELRSQPAPAKGCLDAETLAAWQDDRLDTNTVAELETHLSSCARCQAMVALYLRSEESLLETDVKPAEEHPFALWKWLAPLAAATAAVTLWMIVPGQQDIAVAPPQPTATKAESALPQAELRARETTGAGQSRDQAKEPKEAIAAAQSSPSVAAAAPAPPSMPPAVAALQRSAESALGVEVVTPSGAQRWRVTAIGIERSLDAGGSWALVRAHAGETITAGTSPAADVCWLIGHNGVVMVTADGAVFARVDIPGAGNLRSITATDARTATVVTADGRTFRTSDSGRSWH